MASEPVELDIYLMRLKRIYGNLHQKQSELQEIMKQTQEGTKERIEIQLYLLGFNRALQFVENGIDD
jgi:hypothetical protein